VPVDNHNTNDDAYKYTGAKIGGEASMMCARRAIVACGYEDECYNGRNDNA